MFGFNRSFTKSLFAAFAVTLIMGFSGMVPGALAQPLPTATPTATLSCENLRVLIVHADGGTIPTTLPSQILAEPGMAVVDTFSGETGTPSLALMQQYSVVIPFSNSGWYDAALLGNNLADYLDAGGVVVAFNFCWEGNPLSIAGRWLSDGYSPFVNLSYGTFGGGNLGSYNLSHPLMQGVTVLYSNYRPMTLVSGGASQVAAWDDGRPLIAYKGNAVGVNAYVGDSTPNASGNFGRVVVNAGRWLYDCSLMSTPTAILSTLGKAVLAPVPATRGTKVCMFYTKAPASSEMEIYNANGEKLSKVSTADVNNHCWDTKNAASGVYFVKINVVYADGKSETIWRKAVVIP